MSDDRPKETRLVRWSRNALTLVMIVGILAGYTWIITNMIRWLR